MFLIDLNQVFLSNLFQSIPKNQKDVINENLIRHMVLNTLRSYHKKYKTKYGEMVICSDSKHYWRKDYFPYYKANRKASQDKSEFNWPLIFSCLSKIRDELKQVVPYKILNVDGAEADDIIATLVKNNPDEKFLIISSDGDFVQLQKYDNVEQFSPKLDQYIKVEDPALYLKEHIIRGDSGDGVPNILSNDSVFVVGERQKPILNTKLSGWLKEPEDSFCDTEQMKRNYARNETLIDFGKIPSEIESAILEEFNKPKLGSKNKLMSYFMEFKMKELMEVLDEF